VEAFRDSVCIENFDTVLFFKAALTEHFLQNGADLWIDRPFLENILQKQFEEQRNVIHLLSVSHFFNEIIFV